MHAGDGTESNAFNPVKSYKTCIRDPRLLLSRGYQLFFKVGLSLGIVAPHNRAVIYPLIVLFYFQLDRRSVFSRDH